MPPAAIPKPRPLGPSPRNPAYTDAAFQGLLAASLVKRTRAMSDESWVGSIFRTTWKPFAVTVGVALLSGVVLHSFFPEADRLADILGKG